jgi:nitroimidazol reductase NimA-like FMN-containing flavoprotein (pyridoxamine 5'-phosphate oxidase superfamily)
MDYPPMRRKDRELERSEALAIVDRAPFGSVALLGADGGPYCVVKSFVRDGNTLFFHGALEGESPECFRRDGRVCVSFVAAVDKEEEDRTIRYESAVVYGRVEEVADPGKKLRSIRLLNARFDPERNEHFEKYNEDWTQRTAFWKLTIEHITGKRKIRKRR